MKSLTCKYSCRCFFQITSHDVFFEYSAHKAAHPDQYPVNDEIRAMYPALIGIEAKYGPTPVHFQVYDGMYLLKY